MAKCHRSDVGSFVLDHRGSHAGGFRLWSAFSTAAFRRRIINTVRCGGGFSDHSVAADDDDRKENDNLQSPLPKQPLPRSESRNHEKPGRSGSGSDKLSDLLNLSSDSSSSGNDGGNDAEDEVKRKTERFDELSRTARMLQSDSVGERENAAKLVRQLAKEDSEARTTLAMLGAIPPLVAMVDHDAQIQPRSRIEALYALLNLGIGNDVNKAAIVQTGAVHKMLNLIKSSNGCPDAHLSEAIVANFLALSALDSNKSIIGSSGAVPFLVTVFRDLDKKYGPQAKQDAMRALYNLSILPLNVPLILETDLVRCLMDSLGDMEMSERVLSILSNIVSVPEGRKAVSSVPDAFQILIDVLNWVDSPGCQEKASYVLMVMAHKAYGDRQAMIEAGIASALLELTLIGSTLAQKRASRILECLRVDKGKQASECYSGSMGAAVSAPICVSASGASLGQVARDSVEEEVSMSEEKKAVKQLVQQSLQNNMRRIVKRANLPQDFVPSDHLRSLTASSTSKSLPF